MKKWHIHFYTSEGGIKWQNFKPLSTAKEQALHVKIVTSFCQLEVNILIAFHKQVVCLTCMHFTGLWRMDHTRPVNPIYVGEFDFSIGFQKTDEKSSGTLVRHPVDRYDQSKCRQCLCLATSYIDSTSKPNHLNVWKMSSSVTIFTITLSSCFGASLAARTRCCSRLMVARYGCGH